MHFYRYGFETVEILPKIHKEYNETLPLGYTGRPIVSACNSCTDHISKYIDYNLQPLMKSLPSYVKDTTDFILKLKQYKLNSQNNIFGNVGCDLAVH